jgi:predicted nucleic acid-binding protein
VIRLETDAKLYIQQLVRDQKIELAWSFILDYENAANPNNEVKEKIAEWKTFAVVDIDYSEGIASDAFKLMRLGLRQKDASHIACALASQCDCFLTTDKKILNKDVTGIELLNPIDYVRRYSDGI